MKQLVNFVAATLMLAVVPSAVAQNRAETASSAMLNAVFHVNFEDADRQEHALGNIENVLKEVPGATIEVVSHADGLTLVERNKSKHAVKIAALVKQGVVFVACENTMKKKSIEKDALVAGVKSVASGAVEVLRKQQEGYGYFRP